MKVHVVIHESSRHEFEIVAVFAHKRDAEEYMIHAGWDLQRDQAGPSSVEIQEHEVLPSFFSESLAGNGVLGGLPRD